MAKSLPYFKWYPADAGMDENYSTMTDEELGFYHRCLNHSWINNGLPYELIDIARSLRVTTEYLDRVWPRVGKCFSCSDCVHPRWVNQRQEKERADAIAKSQKATKSVRTRYERRENVGIRASDSDYESGFKLNTPKRNENSPSFEEINEAWKWYQAEYPKEVFPHAELRLFMSVMETPKDIADLRENLPQYKATRQWLEGFAPSSENFLSKRIFNVTPKAESFPNAGRTPIADHWVKC
jgi:uncharacterized protein YdaU (DUF1376 family)